MSELRLYAIINKEALAACTAVGNRGKMMAQAGHAFLHTWWDAEDRDRAKYETLDAWDDAPGRSHDYRHSQLAVKILLSGDNAAQLQAWYDEMKDNDKGIGVSLVTDAGRTIFKEPTITFLGIGPITKEEAPEWLQNLKPFA